MREEEIKKCPLTGNPCRITAGEANTFLISCPEAGGDYRISEEAREMLRENPLTKKDQIGMAAWIATMHLCYDTTPLIDAKIAKGARGWKIPPMPERFNRALTWIKRREKIGLSANLDNPQFRAFCYFPPHR
jgi:hypothetical protein